MTELKVKNLYVQQGEFWLENVNLQLEQGQTGVLVGKSASGRTTLLSTIAGAIRPASGKILYQGKEMYEDEKEIRKRMSVVYAQPNFNMELTPRRLEKEISRFEPWFDHEAFASYRKKLELETEMRVKLYPENLQRKLLLAFALGRKPSFLLMDEVTSSADETSRKQMWELIGDYRKEHLLTILYASHNEEEILQAQQVWMLEHGTCREA